MKTVTVKVSLEFRVPEEAKYVAIDETGTCRWFIKRPLPVPKEFGRTGHWWLARFQCIEGFGFSNVENWKKTLTKI